MQFSIEKPYWLILIPVSLLLFYLLAKKGRGQLGFSRRLFLSLRAATAIFLILALCAVQIRLTADQTTTIFAVDISKSIAGEKDKMVQFIKEAEEAQTEKDLAGIVCFAENAVVEVSPKREFSQFAWNSYVNQGATSIEKALALSAQTFPEDSKKRIVLLTDGNETVGDAAAQARLLSGQGIVVDVAPLTAELTAEAQISKLEIPPYVHKKSQYTVAVHVESLADTPAVLRLYQSNRLVATENVTLQKGENKFVFNQTAEEGGGVLYQAELAAEADTMPENNICYGYCYVEDVPSILILQREDSGRETAEILRQSGLSVQVLAAEGAPVTPEALNRYDCIVLSDVPASALSEEFLLGLETYVKHFGGGLLVTGGEHAYALGDYYGTKLAEILPVDMDLKSESENPDLGMVMVIDHSGSMSGGRFGLSIMEIAKEAAVRGVDGLSDDDYLGVIMFDMIAEWAVPFQKLSGNRESVTEAIGSIQPAGGTSILPALTKAYETLQVADTRLKHIILLTDGQAETTGYNSVLQGIQRSGITLSTVAVGESADRSLLARLAEEGGGRYYFSDEFTDLPQIFIKEAFMAGKDYLNQRTFFPAVRDASPILSGIDALPSLDGYVGTTAKPRADVVLESDTEEPVLAVWQFGLGRTAAFTSDMNGMWTADWLSSREGPMLVRNTVSWLLRGEFDKQITILGERKGNMGEVTLSMPFREEVKEVMAVVAAEDQTTYEVAFVQESPGIFRGSFPNDAPGAFLAAVKMTLADGSVETTNGGFVLPYEKEYDIRSFGNGRALSAQIASLTGGRVLSSGKDVFADLPEVAFLNRGLSNDFLVLAFFLFLLDIAARRFSIIPKKAEAFAVQMQRVFGGGAATKGKAEKKPPERKREEQKQQEKAAESQKQKADSANTASLLRESMKKRNKR